MPEPTLKLVNVSKSFGEVKSLQNINFEVYPGEVVGLLGDNGAGKSTLVKIITGYHQPDPGGEVYFHGKKVDHLTVPKARQLGVETVYQEKALADQQSVWRNIFMGRELSNRFGLPGCGQDAARDAAADDRTHGLYLKGGQPGDAGAHDVGRRTPGHRHHACPLL